MSKGVSECERERVYANKNCSLIVNLSSRNIPYGRQLPLYFVISFLIYNLNGNINYNKVVIIRIG